MGVLRGLFTPIMEKHMEQNMEHDMEIGIIGLVQVTLGLGGFMDRI